MSDAYLNPVHDLNGNLEEGAGLCLSGGGYRAMLFHAGCLWRLNEAGLLGTLKRISSVSGGSIIAGILGIHWNELGIGPLNRIAERRKFIDLVIAPVRKVASTTIDEGAVFGGIFLAGSISDHVASHYASLAFGNKTLQDFPDDTAGPRFVINATNVQSGVLMRFSKPYMRDYRVGIVENPALPIAQAVAASSAFPPILSPCEIDVTRYGLVFQSRDGTEDLNLPPYTTKLLLSDGGVYDNLGLETVWKRYKTILVSDGGGHFAPEPDPHHDWARHAYRVLDLVDSQVRALRTRQLIELFRTKVRAGTYWSVRQNATVFGASVQLPCLAERTAELAAVPTRLKKLDDQVQERLINWGYAICDASLRAYLKPDLSRQIEFPYKNSGV